MTKTTEETDKKRKKLYTVIEHMNASVNILRAIGMTDAADKVKSILRELNAT